MAVFYGAIVGLQTHAHGQGTARASQTNGWFWGSIWLRPPEPAGPLDIVHPVHPLATPLITNILIVMVDDRNVTQR